jgi:hypothetical protein
MYLVELTKEPVINVFREGFFPRYIRYKLDAEKLVKEIQDKGGDAKITKAK